MSDDSMGALHGVNAIVTGSTRGLGFAFARALLDQGARVVISGRDEEACRAAATTLDPDGESVRYVVGGIEVESTAAALVQQCQDAFGRVDFVVNN
ncbi:SDR family NAD(P)-dependent oxidoreductase, partial [Mycobacterium hodleri]